MLEPLPHSGDLLAAIRQALGAERLPVVIGIDGRQGAGKSSLASWLAWQLEVPAVHLDPYLVHDSAPLDWRYGDLGQVLAAARAKGRPIIVEGICLCQARTSSCGWRTKADPNTVPRNRPTNTSRNSIRP